MNTPRPAPLALDYPGGTYQTPQPVTPADGGNVCATSTCLHDAGDLLLCPSCIENTEVALVNAGGLDDDLEVAATRRGRTRGWPSTITTPDPLSRVDTITNLHELIRTLGRSRPDLPGPAELRHQLAGALAAACQLLQAEGDTYTADPGVRGMAGWLLPRVPNLAASQDGARAAELLTLTHNRAMRAIDNAPERVYLGTCTDCGTPLFGFAGRRTTGCRRCGAEYDTEASLDAARERVRSHTATRGELLTWARMLGTPIARHTLDNHVTRGRLVPVDNNPQRFKVGDLLDLLSCPPSTG